MNKNYKYKDYFINHKDHVKFIKSISKDLKIIFINPSEKIQQIATTELLYK